MSEELIVLLVEWAIGEYIKAQQNKPAPAPDDTKRKERLDAAVSKLNATIAGLHPAPANVTVTVNVEGQTPSKP
jgi:hypothetical protein